MRRIKSFSSIVLTVFILILVNRHIAYGYEFLFSSEGNYLRWSASDIPVNYQISVWWLPNVAEPVGAVYAGFKVWEDVATSSFSFNYQGETFDTLPEGEDGVNMIGWNAEAFVGGVETGAIGATYIAWFDTETLFFDEVDIALSIAFQWSTIGDLNSTDVQGIVAHEVGHFVGLGHTDWEVESGFLTPAEFNQLYPDRAVATVVSGPTFYWTHLMGEESLMRTLESDDIQGITVLYPPGYAPAGGAGLGGGCFIATAAYGTPFARDVHILSTLRDELLLENTPGRFLVRTYYKVSPQIAKFIENRPFVRKAVQLHLKPIVVIANLLVPDDTD